MKKLVESMSPVKTTFQNENDILTKEIHEPAAASWMIKTLKDMYPASFQSMYPGNSMTRLSEVETAALMEYSNLSDNTVFEKNKPFLLGMSRIPHLM